MSRKCSTNHADAGVVDPGSGNLCALAVLSDELSEEQTAPTLTYLRLNSRPEKY
jgi:hypothetical protein